MKQQVGDVMPAGMGPVELQIQHPGKERQRLVVIGIGRWKEQMRRERPFDAAPGQAIPNVRVGKDIIGIIEIDGSRNGAFASRAR